jgi:hypothetical protein
MCAGHGRLFPPIIFSIRELAATAGLKPSTLGCRGECSTTASPPLFQNKLLYFTTAMNYSGNFISLYLM